MNTLNLRRVTSEDQEVLLRWRNDPETRHWSRSGTVVEAPMHQGWLARVLASPDHLLYIGELHGTPLGLVRFHRRRAGTVEVSLVVAPEARGHGYGTEILQEGCQQAFSEWGSQTIQAYIKADHIQSLALFARVGFREVMVSLELNRRVYEAPDVVA